MSETETRGADFTANASLAMIAAAHDNLMRQRNEARAESARLRAVVEAVQALADEWGLRAGDISAWPKSRIDILEAVYALRAALAPVSSSGEAGHTRTSTGGFGPDYCAECSEAAQEWVKWPCPSSSGEAESGEDAKAVWRTTQRVNHLRIRIREQWPALAAALGDWQTAPAPVPSGVPDLLAALGSAVDRARQDRRATAAPAGGQADGEGEAFPGHFIDPRGYRFGFTCKAPEGSRCRVGCVVRCDQWGETGACEHDVAPLGYCTIVEWLTESDGDESAEDDHDLVPITVRWDGDLWRWRIVLAARPVLSREALVGVLTEHRYLCHSARGEMPRWEECSCGKRFVGTDPWRMLAAHQADHLADVLAGGEQA